MGLTGTERCFLQSGRHQNAPRTLGRELIGMTSEFKLGALAELLERASIRHHEAFAATNGDDPDWPLWYATYLEDGIAEILGGAPARSRIVQCLLNAKEEHLSSGSDRPWPEFYATYILELGDDLTTPPSEPDES